MYSKKAEEKIAVLGNKLDMKLEESGIKAKISSWFKKDVKDKQSQQEQDDNNTQAQKKEDEYEKM